MSNCGTIKELTMLLENGADAEKVIPYDLSNLSQECILEILLLYIKYGRNTDRLEVCKRLYKEMDI